MIYIEGRKNDEQILQNNDFEKNIIIFGLFPINERSFSITASLYHQPIFDNYHSFLMLFVSQMMEPNLMNKNFSKRKSTCSCFFSCFSAILNNKALFSVGPGALDSPPILIFFLRSPLDDLLLRKILNDKITFLVFDL